MEKASRDAEQQAASLQNAVASMAEPEAAQEALSVARLSLSFARQAYQQAEPSVFYVDPESSAELVALPDPLGAGALKPEAKRLEQLAGSLENLDALVASGPRKHFDPIISLWLYLDAETASLRDELNGLASGWDAAQESSFRQRYFLQTPPTAVARIFQGIIAVTGDLLPNYWLGDGGGWNDERPPLAEVAGRFRAVRNIYAGRATQYGLVNGPGLIDLVREQSPLQADTTMQVLERSLLLAERLALEPGDPAQARSFLRLQAEEVTRQLILSAGAIGIEIIEVGQ